MSVNKYFYCKQLEFPQKSAEKPCRPWIFFLWPSHYQDPKKRPGQKEKENAQIKYEHRIENTLQCCCTSLS